MYERLYKEIQDKNLDIVMCMPDGYDEERMVRDAMAQCRGNISAAARMLGVSRPTFYAKLKKYGL